MQDLENRYIEIRIFEEREPEPPQEPREPREPIGPKIKELLEEGVAFGTSMVNALKESAEENRGKVEMTQKQRREEFRKKRAKRKQKWDEFCNQHSLGKTGDADSISEDMIRDFFTHLGLDVKRKRA